MQDSPVQTLEVRAADDERPVTITLAITSEACRAIFIALSEQLDRQRREPALTAEDVLALREQTLLVEKFQPLADAGAHAVVRFSDAELRACLLALTGYADRADGEHFQPADLRERLRVIAEVTPVLWDANAGAAAAAAESDWLAPTTR